MEHNIDKDGQIVKERLQEKSNAIPPGCDAFFAVTEGNRYVPRAILADLEPTVIGELCRPTLIKINGTVSIDWHRLFTNPQSLTVEFFHHISPYLEE